MFSESNPDFVQTELSNIEEGISPTRTPRSRSGGDTIPMQGGKQNLLLFPPGMRIGKSNNSIQEQQGSTSFETRSADVPYESIIPNKQGDSKEESNISNDSTASWPFRDKLQPIEFSYKTAIGSCVIAGIFASIAIVIYHWFDIFPPYTFTPDSIENIVQISSKCRTKVLPGMTLSIVMNDKVIYHTSHGYADPDKKVKVDNYTAFGIGAITKTMTAAALLLSPSHPDGEELIKDLLGPSFHYKSDHMTDEVTLNDLLSHRTGIPENDFVRFSPGYNRDIVVSDMAILPNNESHQFRDGFHPSSQDYALLAKATESMYENTSTTKWEDILKRKIFVPLKMIDTFVNYPGHRTSLTEKVAVPHWTTPHGNYWGPVDEKIVRKWNTITAADSVMSTSSDMIPFMKAILNAIPRANLSLLNDKPDNESTAHTLRRFHVLTPSIRPAVANWRSKIPNAPLKATSYASGLWNGFYRGYKAMWAVGDEVGYSSIMFMIPAKRIGIFLAFNGHDVDLFGRLPLTLSISDVLLDLKPWMTTELLCSFPPPPAPRPKHTPTQPFTDYTGDYTHTVFGLIRIFINTTTHYLDLNYGFYTSKLIAINDTDVFALVGNEATWWYGGGNVTFLRLLDVVRFVRVDKFTKDLFEKV